MRAQLPTRLCSAPVKTVADVMTRELVTVDEKQTLTQAARHMTERRVGAALVFQGTALSGILTERDILRSVAEGRVDTSVGEWMTRHPETVEPTDTTAHANVLMIHGGFRHLPGVEGERR